MKLRWIIFEGKSPEWVGAARAEYLRKLRGFYPVEIELLKSPKLEREAAVEKKRKEAELLKRRLVSGQPLVLFDEAGKSFRRSEDFSIELSQLIELGKSEIVLCIGGAYGFDPSVVELATKRWSLSGLTMNHWVSQVMALEQVYRALTIQRALPYHNR